MAISIPKSLSSSSINILHLSDIHFKKEKFKYNRERLTKNMYETISWHINESCLKLDLLTITGDIAWAGKTTEYKFAEEFIVQLLEKMDNKDLRTYIVPGNHDVDRDVAQSDPMRYSNKKLWNQVLETEYLGKSNKILKRMKNYYSFISNINSKISNELPTPPQYYFYNDKFVVEECEYTVSGLNSAWACSDDEDHNKIAIGDFQVYSSVSNIVNDQNLTSLNIALMHHPFSFFHEDDQLSYNEIAKNYDIVLRGHTHKGDSIGKTKDGVPLDELSVSAGYLKSIKDEEIGFQFVVIDPFEGNYYIWPYLWNGNYYYLPNEKSELLSRSGFIYSSFRTKIPYNNFKVNQSGVSKQKNKKEENDTIKLDINPYGTDIKTILNKVGISGIDFSMEKGITVADCINMTQMSLSFLGVAAFKWIKEKQAMEEMLKRVLLYGQVDSIRFLLLKPDCSDAKNFFQTKCYDYNEYLSNFEGMLSFFREKRESFGKDKIRVKLYSSLPNWRIVIIDNNKLIIGTYSLLSDTGIEQPQIIFEGTSEWSFVRNFTATFNERWSNAIDAFDQ